MKNSNLQLIECPRDAMQGWPRFIPTQQKIDYINSILRVGFDTIDFGSFVSPKAIPQMADTKEVIQKLDLSGSTSKLLAIVANERGAEEACIFDQINVIGFPFSISETFQLRNTNSTLEQSLTRVEAIQKTCMLHHKELVIYLSMGFGNPYGDPYNEEILHHWAEQMVQQGIVILSLADTVGLASASDITSALAALIPNYPQVKFGVHLHAMKGKIDEKLAAAYAAGCRRFDGAIKGIGGCPMAQNELVGNMDTEQMIEQFNKMGVNVPIDKDALMKAGMLAETIFF